MRASQIAHTSTEICNWSTDPSVRNILTVEVRMDTSCTNELLGFSSGDLSISKKAQQAFMHPVSISGQLLHSSRKCSRLDQKGWEAAELSLQKGVPPALDSNWRPSKCSPVASSVAPPWLPSCGYFTYWNSETSWDFCFGWFRLQNTVYALCFVNSNIA